MLKKIDQRQMGVSNLGWLQSKFHFSFADYYNPKNMNFGVLRVINDDLIQAQTGFDTHPHRDMEIISYVVKGELTHGDSMGNKSTLQRGHVQYMSAGTGIYHSEYNLGNDTARFLQIWILPDAKGYTPNYGEYRFDWESRQGKWLHLVTGNQDNTRFNQSHENAEKAPIKVNQDVHFAAAFLEAGQTLSYVVETGRQAYLVQIEGDSEINTSLVKEVLSEQMLIQLSERDAMEISEETIWINALSDAHYLMIEMKKS